MLFSAYIPFFRGKQKSVCKLLFAASVPVLLAPLAGISADGVGADVRLLRNTESPGFANKPVFDKEAFNRAPAFAIDVAGKVTSVDGEPLAGATVTEKGTNNIVVVKKDGSFAISVSGADAVFVISYVGYEPQEVIVGNKSNITVGLVPAASALADVAVIGYGSIKKKDLTGAVATVTAKDFNKGNYASPDQLIQGKVAGVQITNNNGQQGSPTTIKIRGNSAVTGNGNPLFVVDGILLDGRSILPGSNPLNFLNPNDIASIDVLKDASATAIYGSRAAYGVVLITTKKGQAGKTKLDAGISTGVSSILRKIKVLNASEYRQAISYYGVSAENDKGGNVDALDAITQHGLQQNYSLAVSGGNETGRYRLSTGLLNQQGIILHTGFKKYSADLATNFKFLESKALGLDVNVNTSQTIQDVPYSAAAPYGLFFYALQWNPTDSLRKADGSYNIRQSANVANPLAMAELQREKLATTTVLASISPYYKITNWLEYRLLVSVNYSSGIRRSSSSQLLEPADPRGEASINNVELNTQQITNTLNFNKEVSDGLNVNAVVGFEYMRSKMKGFGMNATGRSGIGFGNYGLDYTNYIQYGDASSRGIYSFVDPQTELQSYFGRAILNYKDRYLLTGTMRADGSTKFGKDNRYGYFPSFSAAWNLGNESFFKVDAINALKIRAGWGKTGNQEFPSGSARARYSFGSNGSISQLNNPNPGLKWQSDKQYNFGIDISVLNRRLSLTADYFHKTTTDLLFPSVPIQPAPPGSAIRWINLNGEVINRGFEAALNATLVEKRDFDWNLAMNATFIKNTVSGLPSPIFTGFLEGNGVSGVVVETIQNGLPMNAFYTRHFLEMDKATGQAVYQDDGNTLYYVGNPNPNTLLGLSTSLRYKKLSMVINMNGVFGQKIFNSTFLNVINVGSINAGKNIALDLYKEPVKESFSNPVTASSRFVEKGDFLRLTNATISYNIGEIAKFIKQANIYVTGQNLFLITKYRGFDPEVNVDRSVNSVPSLGIDYAQYPSARTFIIGLNISL